MNIYLFSPKSQTLILPLDTKKAKMHFLNILLKMRKGVTVC